MNRVRIVLLAVIPVALVVATVVLFNMRSSSTSMQRYEGSGTILQSPQHGPQLCLGGVADSLPPQCGGIPLKNFSWDDVDGEHSASGTTWTEATVQGTYDGESFTVDGYEPPTMNDVVDDSHRFDPACASPDVTNTQDNRSSWTPVSDKASDVDGLVALWVTDRPGKPLVVNIVMRPGRGDAGQANLRRYWGRRA